MVSGPAVSGSRPRRPGAPESAVLVTPAERVRRS